MINFKKGPALSLHQVNYIGSAKADEAVVAGMIVRINEDGEVVRGTDDKTETGYLYGFAINSQDRGDVIESGKIGVYALDGASVIETDQFIGSATSYTTGELVTIHEAEAPDEDAGKITAAGAGDRVIGQVEGTRTIPGVTQIVNGYKIQGQVSVVAVKLFS
jgi:hypothetical protein